MSQPDKYPIERLVREAVDGSREALEEVVRRIQDRLYRLSLRMLFHPADAEDATQEILIKIITHLDSFRHEAPFEAWAYRISVNHLISIRKSYFERRRLSADKAQGIMDRAVAKGWFTDPRGAPAPLLELEMRSACTQALLVTMNRNHRIAFILGVVMEVSGKEGGYIMRVSPEVFRKRLSRSRHRIMDFLTTECGLFDPSNHCRCTKVSANHIKEGWINPEKPVFASQDDNTDNAAVLRDYMKELSILGKVSALYRAFPEKNCPVDFSTMVKALVDGGKFRIFSDLRNN